MRSRKTDSGESHYGKVLNLALLLATCSFVSSLSSTSIFPSSLLPVIVKQISALLLPHSTTSTRTVPNPNDHVLSLRCLALLPVGTWDTMMGEGEMLVIMEGLNSVDDTIRLAVGETRLSMSILIRRHCDFYRLYRQNCWQPHCKITWKALSRLPIWHYLLMCLKGWTPRASSSMGGKKPRGERWKWSKCKVLLYRIGKLGRSLQLALFEFVGL